MQPQIYLGQIPATLDERITLREQALLLAQRLRQSQTEGLCVTLLCFTAGAQPPLQRIDALLLRAEAIIVAALRAYTGPIDVAPGESWRDRETGQVITETDGSHPLHRLRAQRDAVQLSLNASAERLGMAGDDPRPFQRVIGALACVPQIHPDSQISLDVDDHREGIKVCGFDELAGVAAMIHSGLTLNDAAIETIAGGLFGGRLWHDGSRFLFDLAPPRFQFRVIAQGSQPFVAPLQEGGTVIGRRRTARRFEQRIALSGDELVSLDHLYVICSDDRATITIRDDSKNGTWLALPGGPNEHLRGQARDIGVGARLRLGRTELILEEATE